MKKYQNHNGNNNNFSWEDSVTLKEYFESKFTLTERALDLQQKEYARRLDMLNGEAERLRQMQISYLPREVYEANHKELCTKIEKLEATNNQSIGKNSVIAVLVSIGISLAFVILDALIFHP